MDVVYALATAHVTLDSGARILVRKGQHWPATDPVVRAQPSLFSTDARYGLTYTVAPDGFDAPPGEGLDDDAVEAASAAPGERRNVRRRSI